MTEQTKADKLKALKNIDLSHLGKAEAKEFTVLLEELSKREFQEKSTGTFMAFVQSIWLDFINGDHHVKMAKASSSYKIRICFAFISCVFVR